MTPKARILAVDDEPRYAWALQTILDAVGYEAVTAADGQAALALTANEHFDLILLDIKLPDMEGYEVCCARLICICYKREPVCDVAVTWAAYNWGYDEGPLPTLSLSPESAAQRRRRS